MNRNPVIPKNGREPNIIIVNSQRMEKAIANPQTNIAKIITKLPTFSPIAL
jgi:hypothetical protein